MKLTKIETELKPSAHDAADFVQISLRMVSAGLGEKVRSRLQLGAVRLLGEKKVGMHAKSERSSWQSGQVLVKSCVGLPNAAKSLRISETAT